MPCEKYTISIDGEIVAENMPLNYAMLLVKSLFTEYYNDYKMAVEIRQTERCVDCKDDAVQKWAEELYKGGAE